MKMPKMHSMVNIHVGHLNTEQTTGKEEGDSSLHVFGKTTSYRENDTETKRGGHFNHQTGQSCRLVEHASVRSSCLCS